MVYLNVFTFPNDDMEFDFLYEFFKRYENEF